MIAYKAFAPGLICRGYRFVMGMNITEKANCAANGFHCAENPLDCLSYYSDLKSTEFYLVDAGGDIDEDNHDSKIACTHLNIIKRLNEEEFFLHSLAFMANRPHRTTSNHVSTNTAIACCGYAVVRGIDPVAKGQMGDILAFAKENEDGSKITQITLTRVDGVKSMPDTWYSADLTERQVVLS